MTRKYSATVILEIHVEGVIPEGCDDNMVPTLASERAVDVLMAAGPDKEEVEDIEIWETKKWPTQQNEPIAFTPEEKAVLKELFDDYVDHMDHDPDEEEQDILDSIYEKLTGIKLPPL